MSLPIMETIPNHVMMMTGLRPDRTGVPANLIYDRALRDTRDMDRPRDIRCRTVIGRLNGAGFTTGTVLSKSYLYGIFGTRATHRWEPEPIVPVSGHAPDKFTMDATLSMIEEFDPNLVFVNLGDVDRMGHVDQTGPFDLKAMRQVALADTDAQVSRLVDLLKSSGRWKDSVVIVLADHSMDWSNPDKVISLTGPLQDDPFLAGKVEIAQNGGADLLYWTGPAADRDRAVRRMRSIASDVPGVLRAHDRRMPALRLGPEAGEVVVYCRSGWRFTEPDPSGNPIPGNHGHPATLPIPFFIGGGHPRRAASYRLVGAGQDRRRRAHGGRVLRGRAAIGRVRRPQPALTRPPGEPDSPRIFGPESALSRTRDSGLSPRADQASASRLKARRTTSGSVVVHIGGRLALRKPP